MLGPRRRGSPTRLVAGAVAVLATVTGCASGNDGATTGTSASSSGGATASATSGHTQNVVEITVSVQNGKVIPKPRRVQVPLGSEVRLQVTSDVDDEVHVHGLDVEEPVEAGRTTTITLQAAEAGLFEVETHESELQLLQLEVR